MKIYFFFCYYFSKLKDSMERQSCEIKGDSVFYCLSSDSRKKDLMRTIPCAMLQLPAQVPDI